MKVICLTGGMASGKSTATQFLKARGADIIDADLLGHQVYEPDTEGYIQVIEAFGRDLIGNAGLGEGKQIDRKILGGKVFGKPEELTRLTDIVWPQIRQLAEQQIAAIKAANADATVVLEAAVLFEAGWEDMGDEIWVVVVEREIAIERAIKRDGFPREGVESRLDAQLSNKERIQGASTVIDNSTTLEAMQAQLEKEWQRFKD
ncbi:MAG: dephospho-CoA kinase [Pseudomonadales bacterium]|nr:dephospho-CoA kinase [Pseudomonadales bacterium]